MREYSNKTVKNCGSSLVGMGFIDAGRVVLITTMKIVGGEKQLLFGVGAYDPKTNELILKRLDNSDTYVIKLGAKTAGN